MRSESNNVKQGPDASDAVRCRDVMREALSACRAESRLAGEIISIYNSQWEQIKDLDVTCLGGGCCCKFDLADHRVFVTGAEMAVLLTSPPVDISRSKRLRCPWQDGPRCTAYAVRPLSCRSFYCCGSQHMLQQLCEDAHNAIRTLHQRYSLPYCYADLLAWCDAIPF